MSLDSMPNHLNEVRKKIGEIEDEMKRLHMWQDEPLKLEQYKITKAFGMDSMTFDQWIQFILIPKVREILDEGGTFPANSMVGVQALREFDSYPEAGNLVRLLNEFDSLFNQE